MLDHRTQQVDLERFGGDRQHQRQRLGWQRGDLGPGPRSGGHQPRPVPARRVPAGRPRQLVADGPGVDAEPEVVAAARQPGQVRRAARVVAVDQQQRLQGFGGRSTEEAGLGPPFGQFCGGHRIGHHAAAHTAVPPVAAPLDGTDRDAGDHLPARAEHHQGAAVPAPRGGLEVGDHRHRPDPGCPGHRAAGEQGGQHVDQAEAGAEPSGDGGDQLPQRGQLHQLEQCRHRHRPGEADPAQVIAEQVDDHEVLGALLGLAQLAGGVERGGALHGLGEQGAVGAQLEEQLRRDAGDPRFGQEDGVATGLRGVQPVRQLPQRRVRPRGQPSGQVGLVAVPGGDVALDGGHRGGRAGAPEPSGREPGGPVAARSGAVVDRGRPGLGIVVEHLEPGQRCDRGQGDLGGLPDATGLIGQATDHPAAGAGCRLGRGHHRRDLGRAVGPQDQGGCPAEQASQPAAAVAGVERDVERRPNLAGGHQLSVLCPTSGGSLDQGNEIHSEVRFHT